jgi:hypothetical protein
MPSKHLAISVKQPWAALLVVGVKTVEVRTWATRTRGRVLIHAAKTADPRPEGWLLVNTPELKALAALRGGLVGVAELTACVRYRTPEAFAEAAESHRNAPNWFPLDEFSLVRGASGDCAEKPGKHGTNTGHTKPTKTARGGLYGFVFQNPHPIAYHACPGRTLFFTVKGITLS